MPVKIKIQLYDPVYNQIKKYANTNLNVKNLKECYKPPFQYHTWAKLLSSTYIYRKILDHKPYNGASSPIT